MRNGPSRRRAALWLGRMRALIMKELLQIFRDRVILFSMLYMFTFNVFLLGRSVNMQLYHAAAAVRDEDGSSLSRELASRFRQPYFRLVRAREGHKGLGLLDSGKVMMVLDIPPKFEESVLAGRPARIQMRLDATYPLQALQAYNYGRVITGGFIPESGRGGVSPPEGPGALPAITSEERVLYNPNLNEGWFMSIAELLEAVTIFSIVLPAMAMVKEKERGTVEQLLVSPLSPFQVMFSKVAAVTAAVLGWTTICVFAVLKPFFHLPVRGSLALFFIVTAIYILACSGLGLFISTIAGNMAQAGLQSLLLVAPIIMVSGLWTPVDAMPHWLQVLTLFSPLRHYIDASYGIFLKGAGPGILWQPVLDMAAIGGSVSVFAVWRFRRQCA
ncbi:MAG: ABC transporter permease [Nitrospiraceae bacterium]|nr:ABC transporter permease [Nitrospiraceae bacterium]